MRVPSVFVLALLALALIAVAPAVETARSVDVNTIENAAGERSDAPLVDPEGSIVCFVVRTYWGHGDTWGDKSLRRILASLQNQTVESWEALLIVMDNRPFPELRKIVREANDSRIWVHAEWINYKYAPKEGGTWAPNYHNKLYNLTDMAVRACPDNSRWVVITNGDNLYDRHFVETIYSAPPDVDAVAVDFYSRYQRPTAEPCERFEEGDGVPPCKENGMRFCQTDLAANAYKLERLLAEDRRFGLVDPGGTHGANDGIMAQLLKTAGWKIHYVHGRCLVNHAPSPQQCALNGGVWDDSVMAAASSFGGSCVTAKNVIERMRTNPDAYELLELNVTYDRNSFAYANHPFIELRCLRLANRSLWYQAETFGRVCAARIDLPRLPANLPPHPWDAWVPIFESTPDDINAQVPTQAGADANEDDDDGPAHWHHVIEDGSGADEHTEL